MWPRKVKLHHQIEQNIAGEGKEKTQRVDSMPLREHTGQELSILKRRQWAESRCRMVGGRMRISNDRVLGRLSGVAHLL
jgi:hypothetical protein